jgi:hypothetical protein|tara:strand:- start:428 stop:604 length:177 start_codon:yes stop_codon:yes gene_type:complete
MNKILKRLEREQDSQTKYEQYLERLMDEAHQTKTEKRKEDEKLSPAGWFLIRRDGRWK